tara:strand:+ start:919 stop:1365 length:447 start_codon:yes stop_codon:yes gene_type:complete
MRFRIKDASVGAFIAILLMTPWFLTTILTDTPYSNVKVIKEEVTEDSLTLVATFNKDACEFRRLEVIGYDLGVTYVLPWTTITEGGERQYGENYDRAVGEQTLRILVDLSDRSYDKLEIRTRHLCGDILVDKVFTTVVLKKNLITLGE